MPMRHRCVLAPSWTWATTTLVDNDMLSTCPARAAKRPWRRREAMPRDSRTATNWAPRPLLTDGLRGKGDELPELAGGHLGQPALAGADDQLRQRPFLGDEPVDALLERADADELAHLDVPPLADPEGPVGGLVLDGRIPPAVEVHDM